MHTFFIKKHNPSLQHDQCLNKNHGTSKNATRPAFCGCKNCALTSFAIIAASLVCTVDINLVVMATQQASSLDTIHISHARTRVLTLLPHSRLHHDAYVLCFQLLGHIFVSV